MPVFQLTGLSGAGKTTLSENVKSKFLEEGTDVLVVDGDVYRKLISADLGFSKDDRIENIRRLGAFAAGALSPVVIIAAINPYEESRKLLKEKYNAPLIWVDCALPMLIERDTKGLYRRASLADNHPQKLHNLSGVNDAFEIPESADLVLCTSDQSTEQCTQKLYDFIRSRLLAS